MMPILAETPLWLTPVGWVVTFLLGIISAVIIQRMTRKKKVISWSLLSESELFSENIAEQTSLPIKVMVGDSENTSLSAVNLRIGNTGNEVISDLNIHTTFNEGATVLKHEIENPLGEYARHVSRSTKSNELKLNLKFINPKQIIDLEVLLGDYSPGSIVVDLAAPGVELRRQATGRWDISTSILKSIALSIAGIRYDPTVSPLTELAETMRAISKRLDRLPTETKHE